MRWEPFEPRSPNAGAGHSADAVKKAVSPGLEWRSWRTIGSQSRESFIPGPTSVSPSGTRGKSRMHKGARTDPCGGRGVRSSRQGRSLAGCKSPHRQLPVFGRLAYPMRGEATNRVLLGRKSPGCPAGVFAAVGTIWGVSKLGGRNITKYLQPRKSSPARSRFKRDRCGKPTHFPLGKADDTVEVTGASTRWYRRGRGSSIHGQTVGDNVGKLPWAAGTGYNLQGLSKRG